jgi:hypothetical protein
METVGLALEFLFLGGRNWPWIVEKELIGI